MFIKEFVKKILYGNRYSSETYIKYLKRLGVKIGERTVIFSPRETFIDEQYPWMVEIGNDVQITRGVIILTHSYDWSVVKKKYSRLYGASGNVVIKDNVFIGVNTVILKGVTIGENSIIGAGSVVAKDIPANSVAVGNPAKVIHKIDNNYLKNILTDRRKKLLIWLSVIIIDIKSGRIILYFMIIFGYGMMIKTMKKYRDINTKWNCWEITKIV